MSSSSAGRGQKNAPDSPPIARDPGGDPSTQARISQTGKQHKSRLEKYIQEQTRDGAMIAEVFLAVASGRPFPMKYVLHLPLTSEQWALARGAATPDQRRIAMKQPRFIVVRMPYYPTVTDMKEAINWLADRGFGKAPQIVPIESDQPRGWPMVHRPWAPGCDPVCQGDGVIDGKATAPPGDSSKDERSVGGPRHHPTRDA